MIELNQNEVNLALSSLFPVLNLKLQGRMSTVQSTMEGFIVFGFVIVKVIIVILLVLIIENLRYKNTLIYLSINMLLIPHAQSAQPLV